MHEMAIQAFFKCTTPIHVQRLERMAIRQIRYHKSAYWDGQGKAFLFFFVWSAVCFFSTNPLVTCRYLPYDLYVGIHFFITNSFQETSSKNRKSSFSRRCDDCRLKKSGHNGSILNTPLPKMFSYFCLMS